MKRSVATVVDREEKKILQETGIFNLAIRRTSAIVRQHIAGDSRMSSIARDCYMQGVRDVVQVLEERPCHSRRGQS